MKIKLKWVQLSEQSNWWDKTMGSFSLWFLSLPLVFGILSGVVPDTARSKSLTPLRMAQTHPHLQDQMENGESQLPYSIGKEIKAQRSIATCLQKHSCLMAEGGYWKTKIKGLSQTFPRSFLTAGRSQENCYTLHQASWTSLWKNCWKFKGGKAVEIILLSLLSMICLSLVQFLFRQRSFFSISFSSLWPNHKVEAIHSGLGSDKGKIPSSLALAITSVSCEIVTWFQGVSMKAWGSDKIQTSTEQKLSTSSYSGPQLHSRTKELRPQKKWVLPYTRATSQV